VNREEGRELGNYEQQRSQERQGEQPSAEGRGKARMDARAPPSEQVGN
jgi:hypothetical protein